MTSHRIARSAGSVDATQPQAVLLVFDVTRALPFVIAALSMNGALAIDIYLPSP
jgi:hypothetical protein